MSKNIEATRRLVELQGFYGVADQDLRSIDIGLRVAPVFCMTLSAIATATGSANLFWALLPFALAGIVLNGNPFDVVYNHGLRHWLKGPRIPRYPVPRRFACGVAALFTLSAALSFQSGWHLAGQIIGASLALAALVPVITGFCIPSFVLRLVTGKVRIHWAVIA
ncbi:MAG: DUF4395 family protein [Acidiferrobacterales bacterium]